MEIALPDGNKDVHTQSVLLKLKPVIGSIVLSLVAFLFPGVAFAEAGEFKYAELRTYSGFIDQTGVLAVPAKYENLGPFSEGLAAASLFEDYNNLRPTNAFQARTGYINRQGKFAIAPKYSRGLPFKNGYALAFTNEGGQVLLDRAGNKKAGFGASVFARSFDGYHVKLELQNSFSGLCSSSGKPILENKYDSISEFVDGYAVILIGGTWTPFRDETTANSCGPSSYGAPIFSHSKAGLVNSAGKIVLVTNYENLKPLSAHSFFFLEKGKWGVISIDGKIIAPPSFDDVNTSLDTKYFHQYLFAPKRQNKTSETKLAVVRIGTKFFFVNSDGQQTFDHLFDDAWPFTDGLASVGLKSEGIAGKILYGFVNAKGEAVIPPKFQFAKPFEEGLARVLLNDKWGVIDEHGVFVFTNAWDYISSIDHGHASGLRNGHWYVLNKDGVATVVQKASYIGPFSEGLAPAKVGDLYFVGLDMQNRLIKRVATKVDLKFMNGLSYKSEQICVKSNDSLAEEW